LLLRVRQTFRFFVLFHVLVGVRKLPVIRF
jgi:hypothetical protein